MLSAESIKFDNVPAWGGVVRIGSLSADDMLSFIEGNEDPEKKRLSGLRLLVRSIVDADGNRIGDESMIPAFRKKDSATIMQLITAITKLNGLDEEEAKKLGNA